MTSEMVSVGEAAKRVGISTATLRRRVAAGELTLYANALNRRERYVRLEDLNRYGEPQPITRPSRSDNGDRHPVAS